MTKIIFIYSLVFQLGFFYSLASAATANEQIDTSAQMLVKAGRELRTIPWNAEIPDENSLIKDCERYQYLLKRACRFANNHNKTSSASTLFDQYANGQKNANSNFVNAMTEATVIRKRLENFAGKQATTELEEKAISQSHKRKTMDDGFVKATGTMAPPIGDFGPIETKKKGF